MKSAEEQHIKCNNPILMIGEIKEIIIEDDYVNEQQILQLNQSKSIGVNGLETYYAISKIGELPYAKP